MQLLLSSWQGPVMSLNGELLLIEVTPPDRRGDRSGFEVLLGLCPFSPKTPNHQPRFDNTIQDNHGIVVELLLVKTR